MRQCLRCNGTINCSEAQRSSHDQRVKMADIIIRK